MKIRLSVVACALAALPASTLLGACSLTESNKTNGSGKGAVTVASSATACTLSATKVGSGAVTFKVKNTGSAVTEFYLYAADGLRIVGEVENIGPGLTRELVVNLQPGSYVTACKPGMEGKGLRAGLTVTDSGKPSAGAAVDQTSLDKATDAYGDYVRDQASDLLEQTTAFAAAYRAGDVATARTLYSTARQHWERIEIVAESFGDLDGRLDLRQADLEEGQKWTGWHRLEKDLWPPKAGYQPLTKAERATYAEDLLANTTTLHSRVQTASYDVTEIGNGSKGLLDEVASGKVTGREDVWSHTDLYDFQANVEGAKVAFDLLEPMLAAKDEQLEEQIDQRFDDLQGVLDKHRQGAGFVSYDTVTPPERKELSDAVNALSEPLSKVTGVLTL